MPEVYHEHHKHPHELKNDDDEDEDDNVYKPPHVIEKEKKHAEQNPIRFNFKTLDAWIHHKLHPSLHYINNTEWNDHIMSGKFSAAVLFVSDESSPIIPKFEKAAIGNKKNIKHFVITDDTKHTELYEKIVKGLAVHNEDRPVMVFASHIHDWHFKKFKFNAAFNDHSIRNFIKSCVSGYILPHHKSSEKSGGGSDQEIKELVSNNFKKLVSEVYKKDSVI